MEDTDRGVADFWNVARFHARLNLLPGYLGTTALESVQPPAWSFGETPEEADETLRGLLDGSRTSTTTPLSAWTEAGEAPPQAGTLGIVLDGHGRPRALVGTTRVEVTGSEVVEHFTVVYRAEG